MVTPDAAAIARQSDAVMHQDQKPDALKYMHGCVEVLRTFILQIYY